MQKGFNIGFAQNFILTAESIFFDPDARPIDYEKINAEFPCYDKDYDQQVRRREINHLYLLEEILTEKGLSDMRCTDLLLEMEDLVFSPEFYRDLIFKSDGKQFQALYEVFCTTLNKQIAFFRNKVTAEDYKKITDSYGHLSPPKTKEEYLKSLEAIRDYLASRKSVFESITLKPYENA